MKIFRIFQKTLRLKENVLPKRDIRSIKNLERRKI